jgi:3-hydroxyisobutyrate dehydrogenase-like beta-hydroxyacid dehydrogenase
MSKIGVIHPGEMGISIAVAASNNGHEVYWASDGRSDKTRARAENYHLIDANSLLQLCETCEVLLSVCPPYVAEETAQSVVAAGFRGLYLDANAISPQRSINIGQLMEAADIHFVDGGILGGPAWISNKTWLYLSGDYANKIASCFSKGLLEIKIIGNEIGKASALKMCYAAYTKGTTALLATILATAESLGVRTQLYEQWDMDDQGFSDQVNQRVRRVTAKAWRFEGEMIEIASTFQEAGLPSAFHESAAEIYRRMAGFKDSMAPSLLEVIEALIEK